MSANADVQDDFKTELANTNAAKSINVTTGTIVFGTGYDSTTYDGAAVTLTISTNLAAALQGSFNGGANGIVLNDNVNGRLITRTPATSGTTNAIISFAIGNSLAITGFGVKGTDDIGNGAWGGAIWLGGNTGRQHRLENASNLTISDNHVIGGDAITANAMNTGYGGAIYSSGTLTIDNFTDVAFEDNTAEGGVSHTGRNAASSGNTGSGGRGGAIYASATVAITGTDPLAPATSFTFVGNQALSTDALSGGTSSSGWGGAICIETMTGGDAFALTNVADILFKDNLAQGGDAVGGSADQSGRGGAVYMAGGNGSNWVWDNVDVCDCRDSASAESRHNYKHRLLTDKCISPVIWRETFVWPFGGEPFFIPSPDRTRNRPQAISGHLPRPS